MVIKYKEKIMDDKVAPAVAITKKLRENNYDIANIFGEKCLQPSKYVIEILKPREPRRKKFFKIIPYYEKQKDFHIGKVSIYDSSWFLYVYGKDYVPELEELIKKAAKPYKIKVKTSLAQKFPKESIGW